MPTITVSASTLKYANTSSSSWSSDASQGAYQNTSYSRVGVIVFPSETLSVLSDKVIQEIVITPTCTGAGSSGSSKVLTLKKSLKQTTSISGTGTSFVGDTLGTLKGKFYSNSPSHTLNSSSNTSLFENLSSYLKDGNYVLVCHNGEKSSSSSTYSSNYLKISAMSMAITYEEAGGAVYTQSEGTWIKGTPYVRSNGTWVKGVAYIYKNGTWEKSSTN